MIPGLTRAPSAQALKLGIAPRLTLLQVTGLVQDVESDNGRLRLGTEAGAWMQTRRAAERFQKE